MAVLGAPADSSDQDYQAADNGSMDDYEEEEEMGSSYKKPNFTSVPQHFRVRLGDAVRLPCEVDELGPGYTLLWKREEGDILTAGSVLVSYFSYAPYVTAVRHRVVFPIATHNFTFAFSLSAFIISHFTHASLLCSLQVLIVKDPRISHEGNNLVIRNISLFDQGSYICQISTQDQRELRHVIEILGMY